VPVGRAGDNAPRLRDRINAALLVLRGAERRAVVEVGAAVPVAVPRLRFERLFELRQMRAVGCDEQAPVLPQPRQKPSAAPPAGIDSVFGRQRRRVLLQAFGALQLVTNRLLIASFGRTREIP
jgi:hypothetical protein